MLPRAESPAMLLESDLLALLVRWRGCVDDTLRVEVSYGGIRANVTLEKTVDIAAYSDLPATIPRGCPSDVLDVLR